MSFVWGGLDLNNYNLKNLLTKDLKINAKDISKISNNYNYSSGIVKELTKEMCELIPPDQKENICIFLVGSYGRFEASHNSDLDCIFIYKKDGFDKNNICNKIFEIAEKIGIKKLPGETGTFKEFIKLETLLRNIGGIGDTNKNLTRRILILTESYFLYNDDLCKEVISAIFNKYTEKAKKANKEPRELINELVRYYRTITIDYRFKTEEAKKPWGVRNSKLRHSRKFLFFTSIAIIFTAMKKFENNNYEEKYDYIFENINHPPVIKLGKVLIENDKYLNREPFLYYNKFLELISNEKTLKDLEDLDYNKRYDNKNYIVFKENSDEFNKSLKDLIKSIDDWDDLFYRYIIF